MRITSKGQVTIPADVLEREGLLPLTEVEFDGNAVRFLRARPRKDDSRGARLVAHLRDRGDVALSTDAIMALTRDDLVTATLVGARTKPNAPICAISGPPKPG